MVPVIIIAVVFTGLAAVMFYAAPRGKLAPLSNAMLSQKRGTAMAINLTIAAIIVAFGIVVPAIFLVANHNDTSAGITGGIKLTADEVNGRTLFGEHCAVCHTLDAAAAVGKTGPNLDQISPSYQKIKHTLEYGCYADAAQGANNFCLGEGNMPADVVQGTDATAVARFVIAVRGH